MKKFFPTIKFVDEIPHEQGALFTASGMFDTVTKEIFVVKDKNNNQFKILLHELAHWLFNLLPTKLEWKLHDWLDREHTVSSKK